MIILMIMLIIRVRMKIIIKIALITVIIITQIMAILNAILGAKISSICDAVWGSDIIVKITPPTLSEARLLGDRTILSFIQVSLFL